MSVLVQHRDTLLKEIRSARVMPLLRRHLNEYEITDIENELTIRRKNEKLIEILGDRSDGVKLLRMCLEQNYPQLTYIFSEVSSDEDDAPPRPPPPRAAPKTAVKPAPKPQPKPQPVIAPKPKVSVTPRHQPPATNGMITPLESGKNDDNRVKILFKENTELKEEMNKKNEKLKSLENTNKELSEKSNDNSDRELARLKTKFANLEREKDMIVTEKLAMETEQSIILKENELLKKMKSTSVSKREAQQQLAEKEAAEVTRDEALRDSTRLRRELDEVQRQLSDAQHAKDVREDEKRREGRDKARLEKDLERMREELQEERKHASKLSSGSVPLAQFEKIQDELDDARKESRNLARERDTALQEKNTLLMERKDSSELRAVKDKVSQLEAQLEAAENDKNIISFDNAMMKDQLNTTGQELEAALAARDETVAQCELMRKDIDALVGERDEILAELETAKLSQGEQSNEKDTTIRSLRQSLAIQQQTSDDLGHKVEEGERMINKLKAELNAFTEREDGMIKQQEDLQREIEALQKNLEVVTGERDATLADYDRGYRDMEALKDQVRGMEDEREMALTDHQQALAEIDSLHKHIAALERGIQPKVENDLPARAKSPPPRSPPPRSPVNDVRDHKSMDLNRRRSEDRMINEQRAKSPPADYAEEHFLEECDWASEIKVIVLDKGSRGARSFGFTICGGIDNPHYKDKPQDYHIYVLKVQEAGVADGILQPDDALLSVNGTDLSKVDHSYAVNTLKNSGECIELVIRRRFNPELIEIIDLTPHLHKGLGFSIVGGKSNDVTDDPGIYVSRVLQGGAAEEEGTLSMGDRLLTVNSTSVVSVSRELAEEVLSKPEGNRCVLRVCKPPPAYPSYNQPDGGEEFPEMDNYSSFGRRGRSQEDLRALPRPTSPPAALYGPPPDMFRDSRPIGGPMHRAGSTPMLQEDKMSRTMPPPAPDNFGPLKRSSSQGQIRGGRDPNFGLERSRSQEWGYRETDPRFQEMPQPIRRHNVSRPSLKDSLGLEVYTASSGQSGIFVNKLDKNGLCFRSGLRCADQILEVNGINLRNASHDEAIGILSSQRDLNILCQQNPRQYGEMHQVMGTGFHVRALYNYDQTSETGVTFRSGDILHIVDNESMEREGWWQALLIRGGTSVECGDVPSMQHAMHIQRQRRNRTQEPEGKIDKKKSKSLLNVFKAKDDKGNSSSQSSFDDAQYANENPPYEAVVRQNLMFCRPLIILGPLAELLNDRLVNDAPDIFSRCILYTTRPQQNGEQNGREFYFVSQERIKSIQNNGEDKFVECKHIGGHAFYTSASAIKDVAKQNKHCVLNVGVYAIERMQSTDLFPIVVFLKFRSAQDIRDQFNHRCSLEQAQKVFDKAVKLERGYSDKFTAMVSGGSLEEIFTKIHEVVKMNSSNVMWTKQ